MSTVLSSFLLNEMFGIQTVEGFRGIFLFVDVCVFVVQTDGMSNIISY